MSEHSWFQFLFSNYTFLCQKKREIKTATMTKYGTPNTRQSGTSYRIFILQRKTHLKSRKSSSSLENVVKMHLHI